MGQDEKFTKEQIEKWRKEVKEVREELFSDLKFDEHGRIIKDRL